MRGRKREVGRERVKESERVSEFLKDGYSISQKQKRGQHIRTKKHSIIILSKKKINIKQQQHTYNFTGGGTQHKEHGGRFVIPL